MVCNSSRSSLDNLIVSFHELGQAIGLGPVTNNLLTIYPTSFAETSLNRSLANDDREGLIFLPMLVSVEAS